LWSEGSVIRGKYRIIRQIGIGGMAIVYQAEHIHFRESCALKVISPELGNDEALAQRFMQEAILTRRLRHPNAVRVDDIDRAEDGSPFIVMEFLQGQTLHEVMHFDGPLPFTRVRTIALQVASALHAAHSIGIIHRDIKPANIVIIPTPDGEIAKVLDFGIAKLKETRLDRAFENDYTLTVAGMLVGTPAYMSPEQAMGKRGAELDGRSDLYSFAVVVYQMFTGYLPVRAETEEQYVVAHATAQPIEISRHLPELSPPVAALIMRCLSKNPVDRPSDAQVIIREFQNWNPRQDRPRSTAPKKSPKPKSAVSYSRLAWICLAASLVLLCIVLAYFLRLKIQERSLANPDQIPAKQPSFLALRTGDMILVPGGPAILGENRHSQFVRAFYIDKTEVSTRAYLEFCAQTNRPFPPDVSASDGDLPIRNVDFGDAKAFAHWAHKRLPTAAEWEKAARGPDGQNYPWGNDLGTGMARLPATLDDKTANAEPQALPSPVESFPQGASPVGALNMVGNVWEWVNTPMQIRGGSYRSYPPDSNQSFAALVYAGEKVPADTKRPDLGFRCAR
jgi:serine/threonine-protein kinase